MYAQSAAPILRKNSECATVASRYAVHTEYNKVTSLEQLSLAEFRCEYSYLSNRRVYQLSMQGDIFEKKKLSV